MDTIPPMLSSSPPPMMGNEDFGETEEDEDIMPGFSTGRLDLEEDRPSSEAVAVGKKTLLHPLPGRVSALSTQSGASEQHGKHPVPHAVDEPAAPLVNGIVRSLKVDVLVNGISDPSEDTEVPGLDPVIPDLPEKSSSPVSEARNRSPSGGSADLQDLARSKSAAVNEPDQTSLTPHEIYDSMQPAILEDAEVQSIEKDVGSEAEDDWDDWTEHAAVPVDADPVESKRGEPLNVDFETQGLADSAGESPENLVVSDQGKNLDAEIPVLSSEPEIIPEDDEWAEFAEAESFEKSSDLNFAERSDEQKFMPVEPFGLVDTAAVPPAPDIFDDVLAAAFNPEPAEKPDESDVAGGLGKDSVAGGLWDNIENLDETNALGFRWDSSALRRNMLQSLNLNAQSHFAMQKKDPVNLHKNTALGDILIPTTADKFKDQKPNFGLVKPGNESPAFAAPDSPTKRSFADSEPTLSHSTRHTRTVLLSTSRLLPVLTEDLNLEKCLKSSSDRSYASPHWFNNEYERFDEPKGKGDRIRGSMIPSRYPSRLTDLSTRPLQEAAQPFGTGHFLNFIPPMDTLAYDQPNESPFGSTRRKRVRTLYYKDKPSMSLVPVDAADMPTAEGDAGSGNKVTRKGTGKPNVLFKMRMFG